MGKKEKELVYVTLRHKSEEWLKGFEKKYGKCKYEVDYMLYPENDGISDMNNFYIKSVICFLPDELNKIIKSSDDNKESLKDILDNIVSKKKDKTFTKEMELFYAIVQRDFQSIWGYLIRKGREFSMEEKDKENICEFVSGIIEKMIKNLDIMIQEDTQQSDIERNAKGKSISWVDKIGAEKKVQETGFVKDH